MDATWQQPLESAPDESFHLVPLVTAIRWATAALSLLLLFASEEPSAKEAVFGAAILSYALWRTLRPLELSRVQAGAVVAIVAEGAVVLTAIVATGYWRSPFLFTTVPVITAAGFAGGIPFALQAAAASVVTIALPYHLDYAPAQTSVTVQWAGELALVAILAGFVRRLSLQARAESSRFVGRLRQLSQLNDLLLQLRRVTQTLPVSLDLGETLDSSADRMRELFRPDTMVILLRDEHLWSVGKAVGVHLASPLSSTELPAVLRHVADPTAPVRTLSFAAPMGDSSLADASVWGMYAPLVARAEVVGLVALERRRDEGFGPSEVALMEELAQQMAIALDNARWFARISTVAAEQERSRIARDLHDRVGQSLALVGFELERMVKRTPDETVGAELSELREHVRSVVSELRETLYDLRTDVAEDRDLAAALREFLDRVSQRSGLGIVLEDHTSRRLPLNVEREVWRIAQEAVFNAERHANAGTLKVTWTSDEEGAELTVVDDGDGLPPGRPTREGGYGVLGMRERADAIGATLSFSTTPGGGTTVRLTLAR